MLGPHHAAIVERFIGPLQTGVSGLPQPAFQQTDFPDMSFVDDMFPSLWDTIKGI